MTTFARPMTTLIPTKNDETFEIRPARREEMGLVASFVRSSAEWYRPFVDEDDMDEHEVGPEWEARNFELREFFIGCVDGRAVGTISMQTFGEWVYLGYIYLDVEHVGKGYGHQLMTFARRAAERAGFRGLALIAHPEATWATRAYEKFGFECVANTPADVLAWQDGALASYYEQDFDLYLYEFDHDPTVN